MITEFDLNIETSRYKTEVSPNKTYHSEAVCIILQCAVSATDYTLNWF